MVRNEKLWDSDELLYRAARAGDADAQSITTSRLEIYRQAWLAFKPANEDFMSLVRAAGAVDGENQLKARGETRTTFDTLAQLLPDKLPTLLQAMEELGPRTFDDFAAWAWMNTRRNLQSRLRSLANVPTPIDPGKIPQTGRAEIDEIAIADDQAVKLEWARKILAGLPEKMRIAILLWANHDLSPAQIAAVLDVSDRTVREWIRPNPPRDLGS